MKRVLVSDFLTKLIYDTVIKEKKMITKELIERINYLARKKREVGLTPEEEQEQSEIRRQYIEGIKEQIRPMLEDLKSGNTKPPSPVHEGNCNCGHCKH